MQIFIERDMNQLYIQSKKSLQFMTWHDSKSSCTPGRTDCVLKSSHTSRMRKTHTLKLQMEERVPESLQRLNTTTGTQRQHPRIILVQLPLLYQLERSSGPFRTLFPPWSHHPWHLPTIPPIVVRVLKRHNCNGITIWGQDQSVIFS